MNSKNYKNQFLAQKTFSNIYRWMKKLAYIIPVLFLPYVFCIFCSADVAKANEERTKECGKLLLLFSEQNKPNHVLTEEESALVNHTDIQLKYSCSSEKGSSPSCREFYSTVAESNPTEEVCTIDYKKTESKCSRQFYLGSCKIFDLPNNRYEKRIYTKPNDSYTASRNDCMIAGGKFMDRDFPDILTQTALACSLKNKD